MKAFQGNFILIKIKSKYFFKNSYRKAPEYPYPIPTDDSYLLAKYVLDSGNEFGDTDRIILAGDSAGGNIVAVIAQRLNSEQKKMPKLQVLIYPWTQMVKYYN